MLLLLLYTISMLPSSISQPVPVVCFFFFLFTGCFHVANPFLESELPHTQERVVNITNLMPMWPLSMM
uniref:Putative secreted protein n=1 Tax=Amblyomma parvum TaxID=251391 RepID=A0A023G2E5_AMBPA